MFDRANPDASQPSTVRVLENTDRGIRAEAVTRPLLPSVASRKITLRSKSSLRGSVVMPNDRRIVDIESHIEKDGALDLSTRPNVVRVEEQPPAVQFVDRDGRTRQITFDFRVILDDGRRVLVTVKEDARARKLDVPGFLRHVAPQIPPEVADGVTLYTERSISPAQKSNARLMHAVRRDPAHPADQAVRDLLPHIRGAVRIGDLAAATPHGAAAFRAIVRLISRGTILLAANERITHGSLVTVACKQGEAA